MRVVAESFKAVKPHLIRVSLYTVSDEGNVSDYEVIVIDKDFSDIPAEGQVNIDIDKLRQEITKQIVDLQYTAALASALQHADLEWEITEAEKEETRIPKSVEGMQYTEGVK